MTSRTLLAVGLGGLIVGFTFGCSSKKEESNLLPAETKPASAPATSPAPAPAAPAPTQPLAVSPNANNDEILAQLTREVRKWIVGHQRTPQSFEEFASTTQVQVPPPPAGKRYALTKQMKVVLVNR
jgi:hypothetical protein